MDTNLENQPPEPEAILNLIMNAIRFCRKSSPKLCGLARGLEIGISNLQGIESFGCDDIGFLKERSLRLSASRDDYHRGVELGINLTISVVSAISTPGTSNRVETPVAL